MLRFDSIPLPTCAASYHPARAGAGMTGSSESAWTPLLLEGEIR